jgi:hypothetical protein
MERRLPACFDLHPLKMKEKLLKIRGLFDLFLVP